ncbi:hypothetical protein Hanom_Chr07g00648461 [Helianthus anomalus]
MAKLDVFDRGEGGRKRIYQKNSIEPGVENIYTQKILYENYIYNTTERKVREIPRVPVPLKLCPRLDSKYLFSFTSILIINML